MIKYGFEGEYFCCLNMEDGQGPIDYCLPSKDLPKDECGYLAEVRGEPYHTPEGARALYRVAYDKVNAQADKDGMFITTFDPTIKLPKKLLREAMRIHGKASGSADNVYGAQYKDSDTWNRAGFHVHFSNEYTDNGKTYYRLMNIPRIILDLDRNFKDEIKKASRLPGMYEMKSYGFEYRSLPADVNLDKLVDILKEMNIN